MLNRVGFSQPNQVGFKGREGSIMHYPNALLQAANLLTNGIAKEVGVETVPVSDHFAHYILTDDAAGNHLSKAIKAGTNELLKLTMPVIKK